MNSRLRLSVLIAAFALAGAPLALAQGTKPAPKTAKPPAKSAPAAKKPVTPAVVAAAATATAAAVGRALQDHLRQRRPNHRELDASSASTASATSSATPS